MDQFERRLKQIKKPKQASCIWRLLLFLMTMLWHTKVLWFQITLNEVWDLTPQLNSSQHPWRQLSQGRTNEFLRPVRTAKERPSNQRLLGEEKTRQEQGLPKRVSVERKGSTAVLSSKEKKYSQIMKRCESYISNGLVSVSKDAKPVPI